MKLQRFHLAGDPPLTGEGFIPRGVRYLAVVQPSDIVGRKRSWTVTHTPTGLRLGEPMGQAEARELVKALHEGFPWLDRGELDRDMVCPDAAAKQLLREFLDAWKELHQ